MNSEKPYTVTAGNGFLDIRISGDAYKNLVKIAEALNSVEHFDSDNTAETVADAFIFGDMAWKLSDSEDALEEALSIAYGIDSGFKDGTEQDKKVKALLHSAFKKVFSVPS